MKERAVHTPIPLARRVAERLREAGIENARLEGELLLAAILDVSRLDLYLQHDRPLTPDELDAFRAAVRRRLRGEPLQYITGKAHFRELVLHVDRRVLIPRPETEVLAGEVLRWAKDRAAATALDVGTGSGAIALSLAREGAFERIVATDSAADALAVAAENARRLELADRVELRHGSLWQPLRDGERFDVIVSNPPYVAEAERPTLPPEVRDWEPAGALFAGREGLEMLDALIEGAAARLRPGGLLALEVGLGQASAVRRRIDATGAYAPARVVRDLAGRERIVLANTEPLAKSREKSDHA